MPPTESFDWQGRRIAWSRAGSGPAVVFCHGTPFSSRLWQPFADALARDFTVHLWDMPGYGRSSKRAEDPVDFGVQAEAFAALLATGTSTARTSSRTTSAARSRCGRT